MSKNKSITDLGKYLNEVKLAEIKKPKVATEDIAPEQYSFMHINPMTKLQPYPNIASTCMEQMLKRKLVIKKPSCYRNEIIDACICFS